MMTKQTKLNPQELAIDQEIIVEELSEEQVNMADCASTAGTASTAGSCVATIGTISSVISCGEEQTK